MALQDLMYDNELSHNYALGVSRGGLPIQTRGLSSPSRDGTGTIDCIWIFLNMDDPYRGANGTPYKDLVSTFVHERCHGSILSVADCRNLTSIESVVRLGIGGHGTLFSELFRVAANFLAKEGICFIDHEQYLWHSVESDYDKKEAAITLWQQIDNARPTPGELYAWRIFSRYRGK